MHLAIGYVDESRYVAAQVHQGVKLDCRLGLAEVGPREDRETQVDGRRVERIDCIVEFDAEFLVDVETTGDLNKGLCEIGVDAPVPFFVGIGQCTASNLGSNTHVVELGTLGPETSFDVAQAFPVGELRKGHATVLVLAGKALDVLVATITLDATPQYM